MTRFPNPLRLRHNVTFTEFNAEPIDADLF